MLRTDPKELGKVCQVNSSVAFSGKPMRFGEFLNHMFEALGIIIDRHPKKGTRKREG